jgi:mannose/cellobiose epimerase-like protein (N-acyl-D-glucosamine 2-epimerase family)
MPDRKELADLLGRTQAYLEDSLLPFWIARSPDADCGGFLTYFDRTGKPTGETTKTFLMQIRMLYTMASAHRAGFGGGRCAELAEAGAGFILDHYWDDLHDGWVWIADRRGRPTVTDKVGYGQAFAVYAFSEHFLATGDERGRDAALRTYDAVCRHMADTRYGGFFELMEPDWRPKPAGRSGGDRKSMDVHMHMMEALTNLFEMTGSSTHRRRLTEVMDLILTRMLHAETHLGYMQFALDFTPLEAILFETEWGRDAEPEGGRAHPLDMTSPGHNVELAWLLLHAADVLGEPRETYAEVVRPICDHCIEHGIDHELGGVYADVPMNKPPAKTEKQFWQQAEVLIGMLDAVELLGDEKYWRAFRNVYDFVFDKLVVMDAGGEWYERVDRKGNPIDDALGHAWKISYHTVRSMIQVVRRLRRLSEEVA